MKARIVLFLSTHGVGLDGDALDFANDDAAPDRPAAAAYAVRLASSADPADGRTHAHG